MNVGDRIRVKCSERTEDILGFSHDQVGTVRDIDATSDRIFLFISFPDGGIYTSALRDEDLEVVPAGPAKRV